MPLLPPWIIAQPNLREEGMSPSLGEVMRKREIGPGEGKVKAGTIILILRNRTMTKRPGPKTTFLHHARVAADARVVDVEE